jgi:colicin import membrane protein
MLERASDRWLSIALSVVLHGTLVAALAYGFWTYRQSRPPTPTLAIDATVVDARTVSGAANLPPQPTPAAPPKPPEPQPPPEAPPEPVEPTGPPEPTPEELAQREQAQKEQAEKERLAKEQAEQAAVEKQRQLDQQKQQQEEAQRQAEEKAEAERKAQEKAEVERKAQEKAEAERKAAEARKREEQRLAEQKRAEAAQRAAEQKQQAESEAELRNSLAAEEHANQLAASGAVASWQSQISARIHRAWLQPPTARSGLACELLVTQSPAGAVLNAQLGACNGDQAVRESIVAAAYRASPLPQAPDPSLFQSKIEVTFTLQ